MDTDTVNAVRQFVFWWAILKPILLLALGIGVVWWVHYTCETYRLSKMLKKFYEQQEDEMKRNDAKGGAEK